MLETKRLVLRMPKNDDDYFLYLLNKDEDVMKYVGPIKTREQSSDYFRLAKAITTENFGYRIAIDKQSAEFVGWFVLKHLDNTNQIELGYRLLKKYWGQGYATEGSQKMIEFAFKKLNLDRIVAVTMPQNDASQKVLNKLGFRFISEAMYYENKLNFFELRKSEIKI